MEEPKEKKGYQWNRGDEFGKVVQVESSDDKNTYFTDGTTILNEVMDEFLTEIVDGIIPFPGAQNGDPGDNDYMPPPPPIVPTTLVNINNDLENIVQGMAPSEPQISAITELIKKLSSKNIESIDTKLNINIPKKNVAKMLIENSDDSRKEIIDSIVSVAVEQIEINNLQEFLKEEITNFINKYYE